MKKSVQTLLCLLMLSYCLPSQAQVVNFEDTWQEFLRNELTSNVSKLPKPTKEETNDYLKFNLMYAVSSFCAGDFTNAELHIAEIKKLGEAKYATIPSFKPKFDDLLLKIAASYKIDALWKNFQIKKTVTLEEVAAYPDAKRACEKGTLAKCFYMDSYAYYCMGNVAKAKENFEGRVLKLTEKTSLDIKKVTGLSEGITQFKAVFAGLAKLEPAWKTLIDTEVSPGFDTDIPVIDCYTIPNMKVYILRAMVDPCKNGSEYLEKIKALQATNTHTIPADVQAKIDFLEKEVGNFKEDVAKLNKAWKEFMAKDKTSTTDFIYEFPCDRGAQAKAYIMDGTMNICDKGRSRLDDIAKLKKDYNPTLDAEASAKLKALEAKVKKYEDEFAALNAAWEEFVPNDTITSGAKFVLDYPCHKDAQIKAYTMVGTMQFCEKGKEMLDNISKTKAESNPTLDATTEEKIAKLQARADKSAAELADLNKAWKEFIPKDTLLQPLADYRLVDFYCDKMAQVKSWVIKGSVNPCPDGQTYLNKIDAFQKANKLTFDAELACHVTRLRIKVWDCRYWEIVMQARKETHEERERFGPTSAGIMQVDLNGKGVVCPTTVKYEPLGFIGIKYTITVSLCQPIDVAKMGDPEYYKKIATWLNTQVLTHYCHNTNMRCKEGFVIYIEGHTDGNAFSGASYKESLGIPKGTPFTHFAITPATKTAPMKIDTLHKMTDREITKDLKNNMELGIARAWSIKTQLDFMKVPITVGAYEHPASEKGGEFRRIETQLNITNLLLDFYEKRLNELLIASGIGERPKDCMR